MRTGARPASAVRSTSRSTAALLGASTSTLPARAHLAGDGLDEHGGLARARRSVEEAQLLGRCDAREGAALLGVEARVFDLGEAREARGRARRARGRAPRGAARGLLVAQGQHVGAGARRGHVVGAQVDQEAALARPRRRRPIEGHGDPRAGAAHHEAAGGLGHVGAAGAQVDEVTLIDAGGEGRAVFALEVELNAAAEPQRLVDAHEVEEGDAPRGALLGREGREEPVEARALLVALEVEEPEELVEMRVVQRGIRLSSSATLPTAVTAVERAISPVGGLTARGSLVHVLLKTQRPRGAHAHRSPLAAPLRTGGLMNATLRSPLLRTALLAALALLVDACTSERITVGQCEFDSDCASGQACAGSVCRATCRSDADCPGGARRPTRRPRGRDGLACLRPRPARAACATATAPRGRRASTGSAAPSVRPTTTARSSTPSRRACRGAAFRSAPSGAPTATA